jgi:site-specific DNA-methyltransferase (adenine-specific)
MNLLRPALPLPLDQVLLGDCRTVLAGLPGEAFDFCLTDPPYLVDYRDRSGRTLAGDREGDWLRPAFAEVYRALKPDTVCVSFYGWTKVDAFMAAWRAAGFRIAGHLTFPKRYTSSSGLVRYQHESAYVLAKGSPRPPENLIGDVIDWGVYSGNGLHPTQKPISVLTPLIESFCPRGGVVLDPFAGSASTLVAARLSGRHGVGIEIEARMQATANARLQRMRSLMLESLGVADESFDLAQAA